MKKALIACGGTGGHLAPGIALAEELVSRGWSCELLISKKQVDVQLVKKYRQFVYDSIPGCAMSLSPIPFAAFVRDLFSGVSLCITKIRNTRPDAVIGFGGFSSASALLAGMITKTPVAIHEANRVPGRVTRLVSRFANRVYLPADVYLKSAGEGRTLHVGIPIRTEIEKIPKEEAKRQLGFDSERKLLLVFGGSQGARSLNDWMAASMEPLALESVQMYCLTGNRNDETEERQYPSQSGVPVKSLIQGFSDQMALLLSAADMAVSRSGAGSIAEIARCRTPSIFIPYPYAADDHQYHNAKWVMDAGGGLMLNDESMGELFELIRSAISDEAGLRKFESCLDTIDGIDAKSMIADDIEALLVSRKPEQRTEVGVS